MINDIVALLNCIILSKNVDPTEFLSAYQNLWVTFLAKLLIFVCKQKVPFLLAQIAL